MSPIVQYALSPLLDASVKAFLLAAIAAIFLRLLRIRNADIRHRVWVLVAASMLLMPCLTQVAPSLTIAGIDGFLPNGLLDDQGSLSPTQRVTSEPLAYPAQKGPANLPDAPHDVRESGDLPQHAQRIGARPPRDPVQGVPLAGTSDPRATARSSDTTERTELTWKATIQARPAAAVLTVLMLVYGVGLVVMLGRFCIGLRAIGRLTNGAVPIDVGRLGNAPVFQCDSIRVPVTVGLLRPRILLPPAWRTWDQSMLSAVLRHEQAHVDRRDQLTNYIVELNRCIYWFHPLAWFVRRRVAWLAERCCDGQVVLATGDRAAYAAHLVEVAGLLSGRSTRLSSLAPSMARTSDVASRVEAILNAAHPLPCPSGRVTQYALWLVALPIITFTASLQGDPGVGRSSDPQRAAAEPTENAPPPNSTNTGQSDAVDTKAEEAPNDDNATGLAGELNGDPLPTGAATRLGTTRFRLHSGWDHGIAFSDSGETLVSVTESGQLSWWDAQTGKLQKTRHTDRLNIRGSALHPQGSEIALLGTRFDEGGGARHIEHVIQIWNIDRAEQVDEFLVGSTSSLVYTQDGQHLVTANTAGQIRTFDVSSKEVAHETELPEKAGVDALAISPDGQSLAVTTGRKLYLWRWLAEEAPQEVEGFERVTAVAFSPDGLLLAVARDRHDGGPEIILWEIAAEQVRREFGPPVTEGLYARDLDFSHDGKLLFVPNFHNNFHNAGAASSNAIFVWDIETGELVHRLRPENTRPTATAISRDDKWIAAISESEISVWSVETGQRMADALEGHTNRVSSVRFLPTGAQVVTSSDDGTARIWDAKTGDLRKTLQHRYWIRALAVSPDGQWIATSSLDDTVRLWDAASGEEVYRLAGHGRLGGHRSLEFTPDSSRLASWGDDLYLRVWDVRTGKALVDEKTDPLGNATVRGEGDPYGPYEMRLLEGVLSPDASALLIFSGDGVFLYDAATGKLTKQLNVQGRIRQACFSADATELLIARKAPTTTPDPRQPFRSREYEFALLKVEDGSTRWSFAATGVYGPMSISPTGQVVAVSTRDSHQREDQVFLLDGRTGEELNSFTSPRPLGYASNGRRMTFSPDGSLFATAMDDTTTLLWRLEDLDIPPKQESR